MGLWNRAPSSWSTAHRVLEIATAGNNVVADHVLLDPAWVADCVRLIAELPAYFVGVRCPLAVVEERERDRKDRTLGQARAQFPFVHVHEIYDVEVDTSVTSPEEGASAVAAYVLGDAPPDCVSHSRDTIKHDEYRLSHTFGARERAVPDGRASWLTSCYADSCAGAFLG
jgi:hypothetical protein